MHVIGHDNKPNTPGRKLFQRFVQPSQQNTLGMIKIEQSTSPVNGKRDEVNELLVVNNPPPLIHHSIFDAADWSRNLLWHIHTGRLKTANRRHPAP